MKNTTRNPIDTIDRRILDALQRDGALSAADVASRVGLSTTTCWRRIQQLERDSVIRKRVALLDRETLGLDVMVYVNVRLSTQGRDALAQFEKAIRDRPEVLDCCTLTGEWDFCLRIVTHDMKEYEAFFLDHLSKIPNVQSVNSSIVVTVIKESTVLPLARDLIRPYWQLAAVSESIQAPINCIAGGIDDVARERRHRVRVATRHSREQHRARVVAGRDDARVRDAEVAGRRHDIAGAGLRQRRVVTQVECRRRRPLRPVAVRAVRVQVAACAIVQAAAGIGGVRIGRRIRRRSAATAR